MTSRAFRHFLRDEVSRPERLAGRLWGILVVLSVTGSVSILVDARSVGTRTVALAGLGALTAWSLVEITMSIFEALVVRGRARASQQAAPSVATILSTGAGDGLFLFVGGLPILAPLLLPWPEAALRGSNAVAVASLALLGWHAGRAARGHPGTWALALVVAGAVLIAAILALGG